MGSWVLPRGPWQVVRGAVLLCGGVVAFSDWASPPAAGTSAEPGGPQRQQQAEPWRAAAG